MGLIKKFGLKLEAQGKFKVKIRVLIPYFLYFSKLELYDYTDAREHYYTGRTFDVYVLNITPFLGINFSYAKSAKRPD